MAALVKQTHLCEAAAMRVIGLTGGIASGKSTVSAMLRGLGLHVIDADALYHQLIEPRGGKPSPLASAIDARFPDLLDPIGRLDRVALGRLVFANPDERRALEAITHPAVGRAFRERLRQLAEDDVKLVIYEVPLLFERGIEQQMQGVILVWVPLQIQLHRLMTRGNLSAEDARARLAAQMPLEAKRDHATWVIDNSRTVDATRQQVERLHAEITALNQ